MAHIIEEFVDVLRGVTEQGVVGDLFTLLKPPPRQSSVEWAEANRILTTEVSAIPGRYKAMVTPYMLYPQAMIDDPDVRLVIAIKSAQIAWTEIVNNPIGRKIDIDPCNILIAFPTRDAGVSYSFEKLRPFIQSTKCLRDKIGDPTKLSWNRIKFQGGMIKLVTAASISNIKSTNASFVIVEEPNDLKKDVANQGDTLTILRERLKTHPDATMVYGGTPSIKGEDSVDEAYEGSNQLRFQCICHECEQFHVLDFNNLICEPYPDKQVSKKYGEADPYTAMYHCPHCNASTTFEQKNLNVAEAVKYHNLGWKATYPEREDVGFSFNELLSPFIGSTFIDLAKKRAIAWVAYYKGDDNKLKSWVNNSEGRSYIRPSDNLTVEALQSRGLNYNLGVVPTGGIVLTGGVDIQHDRFHLIVRAFGAEKNSWLVSREEIYGNVLNYKDPVWKALFTRLQHKFPLEDYPDVSLQMSAISIDTSDGNTTEIAYAFIAHCQKSGVNALACKGSSETSQNVPLFTYPKNKLKATGQRVESLVQSYGIPLYIVGSSSAKTYLLRQLGQDEELKYDRMYYPSKVNPAYFDQLTSNRRLLRKGVIRYELLQGRRDEDLDCEGLALHASRSVYLHLRSDYELNQAWEQLIAGITVDDEVIAAPRTKTTKGLNL